MAEHSLNDTQRYILHVLREVISVLDELNIPYYMQGGTMLGAVRHKGFIPWDDDVDLLIPREDYGRMISLFKDTERYRLFAHEKDADYLYPYAKICDMTTRKDETGYENKLGLGVDIDLFPLDAWDDDLEKAKKEARYIKKMMFYLGLSRREKADSVNPLKRAVKSMLMLWCKMRGSSYFLRKINEAAYKKEQKGNNYVGAKSWCVYGERGIIPSEAFARSVDIEFEGRMFPAPVGYDTYLTCLYGDYLPEPPKEKQKTHHSFTAYRL